jgi:hypothetical protein
VGKNAVGGILKSADGLNERIKSTVTKLFDYPLSLWELRPDCFDFFQFLEMRIIRDTFGLQRFAGGSYHAVSHWDLVIVP